MAQGPRVLLASQSAYRRELLGRLLGSFDTLAPEVDERPLPGEQPAQLAQRLAALKARAGAANAPGTVVIGSDQVAALGTQILGKPGSVERAVSQLLQCSGQSVVFHTAVCVLGPGSDTRLECVDTTRVRFRKLTEAMARRYVAADQPLDCAGSFKAERRGVLLLESIDSSDPTAIQGLPLIWLAHALQERGVEVI
ncbi:MAG: septum formation protein Maf [Gammaproteobacteria bacterium]|nr:septum formation protein Maf [Gammaproteobacteria bacterium]